MKSWRERGGPSSFRVRRRRSQARHRGGYVGPSGLLDDRHTESFHGGPDQALCLYSLEVIEGLAAEGHSIVPGSAGENVTVRGLDWISGRSGHAMVDRRTR